MKSKVKSRTTAFGVLSPVKTCHSRSIEGKSSIFSDGDLIFYNGVPINGQNSDSLELLPWKSHIFDKNFWKVFPLKSWKIVIFEFWFNTCRRKITRGFRIWPYFLHFLMQKWSKTWIYDEFPIFECIEIYPNLATNHRFWPLLRTKFEKVRSDSESSCNFTSTCTKPKIENQFFPWFRAQYF